VETVMAARLPVASLDDPEFAVALGYWSRQRGAKSMPARADIDPIDLVRILPKVLLIDVLPERPFFRFRVVGTSIVDWANFDATGRTLDDIEPEAYRNMLFATYNECRGAACPIGHRIRWDQPQRVHRYKRLLLPLSPDGLGVDMILSCSVAERFLDAEPFWSAPPLTTVRY
jgi:hypothetical protein